MSSGAQEPAPSPESIAIEPHLAGDRAGAVKELTKILLAGSPAEIEERARAAAHLLPADRQAAGGRLLDLGIALAANPGLRVRAVTFSDSSQELLVTPVGAAQCAVVTVRRDISGVWCAIRWTQWAPIHPDTIIASTAGLITAVLGFGMPQTGEGDAVLAAGRKQDDMQTAELIAAYRHARALVRLLPPGPLAKALAGWMFIARRVLTARGKNLIDPGFPAEDGAS